MKSYNSITAKGIQNDLQEQLEALVAEVRLLNSSVTLLRQDDLRLVFGEQIKPILMERINRFFSGERETNPSEAGSLEELRSQMAKMVESTISSFQQAGKEEASRILNEFESSLSEQVGSDRDPGLLTFLSTLVRQVRDYFAVSDQLSHQTWRQASAIAPSARRPVELSPVAAERILGPLANAWRIDVLSRLAKDNESLAGLSKALGLKKGHLQFHLNTLIESEFIRYDRKSHLYSITSRGEIALDVVANLVDRMNSGNG